MGLGRGFIQILTLPEFASPATFRRIFGHHVHKQLYEYKNLMLY